MDFHGLERNFTAPPRALTGVFRLRRETCRSSIYSLNDRMLRRHGKITYYRATRKVIGVPVPRPVVYRGR